MEKYTTNTQPMSITSRDVLWDINLVYSIHSLSVTKVKSDDSSIFAEPTIFGINFVTKYRVVAFHR